MEPNSTCVGRTIGELQIRKRTGATIIAVIDKNQKQTVNPGPDYVLKAETILVVMGERQQIKAFKQLVSNGSE